jgi:hypothetical protein
VNSRRLLVTFAITGAIISLPFTVIHLIAKPDDAPITLGQHIMAAAANFFGPWGVAIVRLVDFPNAGLRSFSWALAVGLTLAGALLVALAARIPQRSVQWLLTGAWVLFALIWFGVGLRQIADGLL